MSPRTNRSRTAVLFFVGLIAVITVSLFSSGSQGGSQQRGVQAAMRSSKPACPSEHKADRGTDRYLKFTQDNQLIRPTGYRKWIYAGIRAYYGQR